MELQKNPKFIEAMNQCKLSSFKNNFGHDRMGAMGNVSINRKKAFEFHDDGWGGDTEVNFAQNGEAIVKQFIADNNIQELIFLDSQVGEYQLFKTKEEVDQHYMIDIIFSHLSNKLTEEKEVKKIERAKDKKVMMGTAMKYQQIAWKKLTLSELVKLKGGVAALQKTYDEFKAEMKEGEQIFNTEHLKSLGVKL